MADAGSSSSRSTGDEGPPPQQPAQQPPQQQQSSEEGSEGGRAASAARSSRAGTPQHRTALEREVDRLLVDIEARYHSERGGDPLAVLGDLDEDEDEDEQEEDEEEGEDAQDEEKEGGGAEAAEGAGSTTADAGLPTLPALIARLDGLLTTIVAGDAECSSLPVGAAKGLHQALIRVLAGAMDYRPPPPDGPTPPSAVLQAQASSSLPAVLQAAHAVATHAAIANPTAPLARVLSGKQREELASKAERVSELHALLQRAPVPVPAPTTLLDASTGRAKGLEGLLITKLNELTPPSQRAWAIQAAQRRLESVIRSNGRFRDGRIHVFGSALSELGTARSDVDYCLVHPGMERQSQMLEQRLQEARAGLLAVAKENPRVVRLVLRRDKLQKTEAKRQGAMPGKESRARREEERLTQVQQELKALELPAVSDAGAAPPPPSHRRGGSKGNEELERRLVLAKRDWKKAQGELREGEAQLAGIRAHLQRIEAELAAFPQQAARAVEARRRMKKCEDEIDDTKRVVFALKRVLESARGYLEVFAIARARVPIVKFRDPSIPMPPPPPRRASAHAVRKGGGKPFGGGSSEDESPYVQADLCINNAAAVYNTNLIAAYVRLDPRLRGMIFLVKAWARARALNEARTGSLSSYAYSLLCIGYMQAVGLLPSLQDPRLLSHPAQGPPETYRGLDVSFCKDLNRAHALIPTPNNRLTLGQLLLGFFHFYGHAFNPTASVVSVRLAKLLDKKDNPPTLGKGGQGTPPWRLSIEDPFEAFTSPKPHDLGDVLNAEAQARMLKGFRETLYTLQAPGSTPHEWMAALFGPDGVPNTIITPHPPQQGSRGNNAKKKGPAPTPGPASASASSSSLAAAGAPPPNTAPKPKKPRQQPPPHQPQQPQQGKGSNPAATASALSSSASAAGGQRRGKYLPREEQAAAATAAAVAVPPIVVPVSLIEATAPAAPQQKQEEKGEGQEAGDSGGGGGKSNQRRRKKNGGGGGGGEQQHKPEPNPAPAASQPPSSQSQGQRQRRRWRSKNKAQGAPGGVAQG